MKLHHIHRLEHLLRRDDINPIANVKTQIRKIKPLPQVLDLRPTDYRRLSEKPIAVEDRRQHHPLKKLRPALSLSGHPHHTLVVPTMVIKGKRVPKDRSAFRAAIMAQKGYTPSGQPFESMPGRATNREAFPSSKIQFKAPNRVVICLKRKARREVMHAYGLAGIHRAFKKPKRNYYSDVRC